MLKRIINSYIAPALIYPLIYSILVTLRLTEKGKEHEKKALAEGKPLIYTFWHSRLLYFPHYYRKTSHDLKILISPSVDGEIITRIATFYGFGAIRGSSFKQARKAFMALKKSILDGFSVGLVADGSRGPSEVFQPGSLMLSKLTGSAVIPLTVSYSSFWTLKTWDRTMIPKPFSDVVVIYGKPVTCPKNADSDDLERLRATLGENLSRITGEADSFFNNNSAKPQHT